MKIATLDAIHALLQQAYTQFHIVHSTMLTWDACAYTAKVRLQDGRSALLKHHAQPNVFQRELEALLCYQSHPCIQLLNYDTSLSMLLYEDVAINESLNTLSDKQARINITTQMFNHIWTSKQNEKSHFPHINEHLNKIIIAIESQLTIYPQELRLLFKQFKHSLHRQHFFHHTEHLLHGNLYYRHIVLNAERKWVYINPTSYIGPKYFDLGVFVNHTIPRVCHHYHQFKRTIQEFIITLTADLKLDLASSLEWSFIVAMQELWVSYKQFQKFNRRLLQRAQWLLTLKNKYNDQSTS